MFRYSIPAVCGIFIAWLWHVTPDIPSQDTQPNHNDQCWMLSRVALWVGVGLFCCLGLKLALVIQFMLKHGILFTVNSHYYFQTMFSGNAISHNNWKVFSLKDPQSNCEPQQNLSYFVVWCENCRWKRTFQSLYQEDNALLYWSHMPVTASQINGNIAVCSTDYSGKKVTFRVLCDRMIPLTKGQLSVKTFHVMASSCTGTLTTEPRPDLSVDALSRYGIFHYKDKTVVRPSYLCNGNPYTGKTFLYWDGPRVPYLQRWSIQGMCPFVVLSRSSPFSFCHWCLTADSRWNV